MLLLHLSFLLRSITGGFSVAGKANRDLFDPRYVFGGDRHEISDMKGAASASFAR